MVKQGCKQKNNVYYSLKIKINVNDNFVRFLYKKDGVNSFGYGRKHF